MSATFPRAVAEGATPKERQRRISEWLEPLSVSELAAPTWTVGEARLGLSEVLRSPLLVLGAELLTGAHTQGLFDRHSARLVAYQLRQALRSWAVAPTQADGPSDVVMVPRMPGHLVDLRPVARALRARGREVRAWWHPVLEQVAEPDDGWVGPSRRSMARMPGLLAGLVRAFRTLAGRVTEVLPPGPAHLLEDALRGVVLAHGVELAALAAGWVTELERALPRVVVVGNPNTLEGRLVAFLARAYRVPVAALEHGTIFGGDPFWARSPVDVVLAWGEPSRRALVENGVSPERVTVTGAPRLDLSSHGAARRSGARVLVATSGAGGQVDAGEQARFINDLSQAVASRPDLEWVVKLHPKDLPSAYESLVARAKGAVRVIENERRREGLQIFELLAECTVLVTITSTSAIDAMAVGVPVVTWLPRPLTQFGHVEFLQRGATAVVVDARGLVAAIDEALAGRVPIDRRAAAERYADAHFTNRGRAAATAAEALDGLARRAVTPAPTP